MEPLSAYEKETVILFNNAEKTATVYAYDTKILKKLKEAIERHPDKARIMEEYEDECMMVEIPKEWVNINLPRQYSPEGRKEMEARLARMRENLKKKNQKKDQ